MTLVATTAEASDALAAHAFLVVIVDLALPDGAGSELVDELRTSGSTAHVIVLGASAAEADRVDVLRRGADDYVVKPFFVRELTERVLAVGRRQCAIPDALIHIGHCEIDLGARQVTRTGQLVDLTAKEFDLLAYLAARPGHVFSREQLLSAVWRSVSDWQQLATVTEHVRRLRKKIELDPAAPTILVTVRGAGYRLDVPASNGDEPVGAAVPPVGAQLIQVDGRIVFADAAAGTLFGASDPATLVGLHVLDLVAPASQTAAAARLEATNAGRPRRSEIIRLRCAEGRLVMAAVSTTPTEWQGKQGHRVELAVVADAPERLRGLFTGVLADVTDAVIITDLSSHIRSWNTAAERLYGWSGDAVLGRHVLDVLQPLGDDQLTAAWEQLHRKGHWHGTARHIARDGSTVDVLGSKTLLRDDSGEPVGVVSVNRAVEPARLAPLPDVDAVLAERVELGIANDEFVVHYQPVVDLGDRAVLALEALVRWEHPERGTLAPAEFLGTAERTGLIVPLGEVVLDKACRQAAAWRSAGADVALSVNVSAHQLADPDLVERFVDIIRTSGFDPAHLWLEITETSLVEEIDGASLALRTLVALGVGVSIDDFGTGWASLTYLRNFPVHTLKIDRTFVAGVGGAGHDGAIVRSVLSLAAELDLFAVAEGIETEEQHRQLLAIGCTLGQGYLYGPPTAAGEVPIHRAHRVADLARGEVAAGQPRLRAARAGGGRTSGSTALLGLAPVAASRAELAPDDRLESEVVADLLRGLLRVGSAPAAADLLRRTVRRLGGDIVPVDQAGDDALPIDISLGEGPPMVVEVEAFTAARMQLERLLPRLVEDARQAVDLLRRTERLDGAAR